MNRITSPLGRGRNRHPIPGEGTPLDRKGGGHAAQFRPALCKRARYKPRCKNSHSVERSARRLIC